MDTKPTIHAALISDQFTRQAQGFSTTVELHNDAALSLLVNTARPAPGVRCSMSPAAPVLSLQHSLRMWPMHRDHWWGR